jgi:hypothetical protein
MKPLLREFFQSLKERDQLDKILPEILAETGFTVFSRPGRGTTQHGVDVAASRKTASGEEEVFLFTIKSGNLDRATWDGSEQAVRSSLNEIIDVYVPTKLPAEFASAKIKICICLGGEVKETVRSQVTQFQQKATTDRVSFEEWNGDRLAEILLENVLGESLVPEELRVSLRKALALVDEPDVSFQNFADYLRRVSKLKSKSEKERLTALRQMYLGLWILYGWCQQAKNLEAAYLASERTVLHGWEMVKDEVVPDTQKSRVQFDLIDGLIRLHILILMELTDTKIVPHVRSKHALSSAVGSQNPLDVNLKLFECLARLALLGHWLLFLAEGTDKEGAEKAKASSQALLRHAMAMIQNNRTLFLPVSDKQVTAIGLVLSLALFHPSCHQDVERWLSEMARRYDFSIRGNMRYPSVSLDYHELVDHPKNNDEDYFKDATSGSVLLPMLYMWLTAFGCENELSLLRDLKKEKLEHCTLQLWFPDASSETHLYLNSELHGVSLLDLELSDDPDTLIKRVDEEAERQTGLYDLTAMKLRARPLVLIACKHYHLPIPPQFWVKGLIPSGKPIEDDSAVAQK